MDYWAENQGHLTEYNKFNTVPSRSCTQNYLDRQPAPPFPIYYGDQQHKTIHSGYWPSRDVPNWTHQESTNMTSSQNFPFSFGHPIQRHYSDVGEQQRQEARDWATYQLQQERGMQREGWSYNPAHCKRDLSRKNESNFRELEAWALRYSHSLPRRRRIEAELRGARQDNIEKRDMQMQCIQDSTQWDRASRQQAPNYCQTTPASPSFDVKDRLGYPPKLYSHPPNYNAPPSYNVQFRSVSALHKFENQNKLQQEVSEKCPSKVVTEELETLQVNRQLVLGRSSNEAAKVIEGRKFRLNKKAGGMTIFCLVSRIADTERESVPVSQKQSDAVQPKSSNVSQPLKLADEVDFKEQTPTKHARSPYSKLQAIPICQESLSKMVEQNVEKKVSAYEKLQIKFPLWRRPSNTSYTESENAFETSLKDTSDSKVQDEENGTKSSQKVDKESVQEAKDDAKLMIDTTCVVVKMEVLQGPKKEQVHYVSADNQSAQRNRDNLTNPLDTGLAEDFKTLPEQEAKGNGVDEKAQSENAIPGNSNTVSESLEERAKRICGLHDSTMIQPQEEVFDLGVDVFPKENDSTNDFERHINQGELQNAFTKSKTEHLQPEELSICKDEVIGEASASTENIKENGNDLEEDRKLQISKRAENQEQESNGEEAKSGQSEEPVEIDHCTDALDNLALFGEERDNEVLPTQYDSSLHDSLQNGVGLVEVDADTQVLDVYENNTMQSSLIGANIGILSDDSKGKNQDQEATEKVIEGDFEQQNIVEKLVNSKLGELSNLELEPSQRDEVSHSNDGEKDREEMVQVSAIETLQQLDSGQVEAMPALEILSESEQKLKANDEMDRGNAVEPECEPKADVCCTKEDIKNSDKDMDAATSDFEIQEITERVIEVHDTKGGESNAIKDTTCSKEQSAAMEQVQADILATSNLKDQEQETQLDSLDDLKEHFHFGCHEKALVKEEGLCDEDNTEKKLPSVDVHENQDDKPQPVKDTQVETPSEEVEEVEQKHDEEDIDNVNEKGPEDQAPSVDVSETDSTNTYSEMCKAVRLQNNTEDDQEEDEMCTKNSKILEVISEKAHTLEKLHDDEKVENNQSVQVQEIAVATCVKEEPEDADFSVGDDERGKEPKIQKDTDLKGHILEEIGFIDASDFKVQDFDLQPCELEDATCKSGTNEDELIKDNGKSNQDTRICQSTNKDTSGISLVCDPNPILNNNAASLDRSTSSMDPSLKSVPPTSTCDSNFENVQNCGEEEKYPKSLWDAVSRIRKHTAPDSENEEEEVTDSWDRESFADNIVGYEHLFDHGYIDITEGMQTDPYCEGLNMQDDTLSQCSNSSQGSDGTIVDDELEVLSNTESTAICIENQGSDEEKFENEPQNGDAVNKTGQIEEMRVNEDAEMPDEIKL